MARKESDEHGRLIMIGQRIKKFRKAKGYSNYEQFAFTHGIGRSQYGRYENGENMRLSTLLRVLDALEISLEDFFKGSEI